MRYKKHLLKTAKYDGDPKENLKTMIEILSTITWSCKLTDSIVVNDVFKECLVGDNTM